MVKRRDKKPSSPTTFEPKTSARKWLYGLITLILGILSALAIFDYHPDQNPMVTTHPLDQNLIGEWGGAFAFYTTLALGVTAWILPLTLFWMTYMFWGGHARRLRLPKLFYIVLYTVCASVFAAILYAEVFVDADPNKYRFGLGGWLGSAIYNGYLQNIIGMVGTLVVFGVTAAFSLGFVLADNLLADSFRAARKQASLWAERRANQSPQKKAEREQRLKEKEIARIEKEALRKAAKEQELEDKKASKAKRPSLFKRLFGARKAKPAEAPRRPSASGIEPLPSLQGESPAVIRKAPTPKPPPPEPEPEPEPIVVEKPAPRRAPAAEPKTASELKIIASEQTRKASINRPEKKGDYRFPPMRLLSEPVADGTLEPTEVHQQTAEMLVRTLAQFNVDVTMGEVHVGPVITRYDVYPAPGVRVEKIVNLDKNLALGLKALSVRILAPVPGKGCVGIEVPNKNPQAVYIRDILESEDWVNTKAEIPIALGKEVSGKPLVADLTKMPHLLIAGSTGSGKTVCINTIVTSLLYHSSPEDIRFVMVDPKIVEMQVYNSLPHMLVPVVTDPKKVPNALKYLLNEMEKRYQIFATQGVRNIAGYNAKMARNRKEAKEAEERAKAMDAAMTPEERAATANIKLDVPRDPDVEGELPVKLPYIVCIVDELADLMMVAPADIETGIARLAQLARAAGIHLILATQRPSVNVITGVIKANLPSRIAFKVASKVDSRTILDTMGADHLIGKGDMLFLPPGSADLVRSQGAFVSDEEINDIVGYIHEKNGEPEFDQQFQRNIEEGESDSGPGEDGEWDDELVPDAIEVIRTSKRASTSMLQRRLKIGYNRAARIMEILEDHGMVGPENGSSPREILMDMD
ncbi:MAG: DNA translocase FtsK [Opitutales bacterium]|nr:DNA translocase FtsK [Opitutales bacterium]